MAGLNISPTLTLGREWVRATKTGDARVLIEVVGPGAIEVLPNTTLPTEAARGLIYNAGEKYREDALDGATIWIRAASALTETAVAIVTPSTWTDALPALGGPLAFTMPVATLPGASVFDLPDPVKGERRRLSPNDGRFVVNAAGDVVRGLTAVSANTSIALDILQTRGEERVVTKATVTVPAIGGAAKVFRGMGQGMTTLVSGYGIGDTNRMQTMRRRHNSPVPIERCRIVYQGFDPFRLNSSNPVTDTKFANIMHFQGGLESPFKAAMSGLDPRVPFRWDGANYKTYDPATFPANEYLLVSDILDVKAILGRRIEAGEWFGLWTTVDLPDNVSGNNMPLQDFKTNATNRYTGVRTQATRGIAALGGTDYALNSTTIQAVTTNVNGSSSGYGPVMLLVEVEGSVPCVVGLGDSFMEGQIDGKIDGALGVNAFGDIQGSPNGNAGYFMRAMNDRLATMAVNLGRGGDGDKYLRTPANWPGRRQVMKLANPTVVDHLMNTNDISAVSSTGAWTAGQAVVKRSTRHANGNYYMALNAGTCAASGAGPSGTGASIADNDVLWVYLGPRHADDRDGGYALFGQKGLVVDQIKAELPLVKVRHMMPPPRTTAGNFVTLADQSVENHFATAQARGKLKDLLGDPTKFVLLGADSVFDLTPAWVDTANPDKWKTNPDGTSANYMTPDGTHPGQRGHVDGSALHPATPAVTPAQLAA